jgi:elongation factor 2
MAEKMVEKVTRLMKEPQRIRNIGVAAHIDHGKTTFSDNLLQGAGMMSEELAGKARQLDFHEDEQERGITIDSASVSMVHSIDGKEFLINLIDTPGHVDFGGDVTRAMRAVDGAIVLICASEGPMPQTETVVRQALKERVKPVLFINKTDRLIKELQLTPEQMQQRFVKQISEVNKIIRNVAPEEYKEKWQVSVEKGTVGFGSAFHNWAVSLPYMQKKGITFKEVIDAYQGTDEEIKEKTKSLAKKAPLHEVVLDMVTEHHPDPAAAQVYRIPRLWHGDLESTDGQNLIKCNPDGRLFFVITKVVVDPQAGEIAAGRLFGGTMHKGDEVFLNMANVPGRIQQVYIYNGAKREIVDNVPAGNIIGVGGLRDGRPGETVTTGGKTEPFEKITHIFDPVVTKAIEAKNPADLPKLIEVLRQVQKEDPTIIIEINEETGEHLMHGMGELHLEVIENRIVREKGVQVSTSPPIVVYREAITKVSPEMEGKSPNKHNKLFFKVEPLEDNVATGIKEGKLPHGRFKKKDEQVISFLRDECDWDAKLSTKVKAECNGNIFLDQTRGIVQINEIMELVLDMFEDVMKAGPLAKEPCLNVKVSLMDCTLHEDAIHRGPAQMYPAVREGIKGALMQAGPILYEPLQVMRIEAPNEYVGEISKLVSSKRGQLLDMQQEGNMNVVQAKLPVGELFGWSNDLRSATGGRGNSSLIDQSFERLPGELQEKIKKQIVQRKGLSEGALGA